LKTKCLIAFLLLAFASYGQKGSAVKLTNYPLQVTLENLDSANVYNHGKSYSRNLRIRLTNTADSAFSFWLMSCDWHGCVRLKPQIAGPNYWGCDKNVPQEIILKPKQSHVLDFEYGFSKRKAVHPVLIRAGFRVITQLPETTDITENKPEPSRLSIFSDNPKYTDKDFIWSNKIKIAF